MPSVRSAGRALQIQASAAFARARRRARSSPPSTPSALLELLRSGPAALGDVGRDDAAPLELAVIIPSFRRGSGGHATIVNLMRELQARGHSVTVWLEDSDGRHRNERASVTRRSFAEFFRASGLPLETSFGQWRGADVVLATGWQTVARALLLPGAGARAYLVQDHEPEFYGTSAEALWAERTYGFGLHCIAASPWLAKLLATRYGASTSHFDLAVDHDVYGPRTTERRNDLVIFYARAATPRRAVPLGLLALEELARRRPSVEIALYGESGAEGATFAHRHLGVLGADDLATLYSQATAGMVLSLTNPSLVGLEMMACGLPCVDVASEAMIASFGPSGPLQLADDDPLTLCAALELLLDRPELRARAAGDGVTLVSTRTWGRAAQQVERGLRAALSGRQAGPAHNRAD